MLIDAATQTFLDGRTGLRVFWLYWMQARNRSTGLPETAAFWTGTDDRSFTIDGQPRVYVGAGGLLGLDQITYEAGTNIQMHLVRLAPVAPEVEQAILTYDPRLAPIEVHMALFDQADNSLVSVTRALKGTIDRAPIKAQGSDRRGVSERVCEIHVAGAMRRGTRTLPVKKSDSAQQQRGGDRGRRYGDVSGTVVTWWGEYRVETGSGGSSKFPKAGA